MTRLKKGNINREAFASRLTDIPSMGLRFICAKCRGPATFDAKSKATTCVKAQDPCGLTTAEYTIMPKLEIHPMADGTYYIAPQTLCCLNDPVRLIPVEDNALSHLCFLQIAYFRSVCYDAHNIPQLPFFQS